MVEPLAILLIPGRLDEFELADHARGLLAIPRVVALEPRRTRPRGWFTEAAAVGQARRLRLPGEPRLVVLYDPRQYPLARAICARYDGAELWYVRTQSAYEDDDYDQLARQRAAEVLDKDTDTYSLRRRLIELEVINPRPFFPGARIATK